jgi:hypothetical protein
VDFWGGDFLSFEFDVAGGARVVGYGTRVAQVGGGAGGGVDAHVAHRAADGELVGWAVRLDAGGAERFLELRFAEAVGEVFHDHGFAGARRDACVVLCAGRAGDEEGGRGVFPGVLDVEDGLAGAAEVLEQSGGVFGGAVDIDERHAAAREVVVLEVDDDESGHERGRDTGDGGQGWSFELMREGADRRGSRV